MQAVYLKWEDVSSSGSSWYEEAEVQEWADNNTQAFVVEQIGFVIKETKRYILLCSHYHPETPIVPAQYGHLQKILKTLIIERKNIKL